MEAVPEFLSVTVCAADEELTVVEEKVRLEGDKLAVGAAGADETPGQPFTTFATLSEPRPVALS
jgi:hypothetical protein